MEVLASGILRLTVYLANLFGGTSFIDKLVGSLQEAKDKAPGLAAAPGNARIEGFDQIGKDIAQAAFVAQQGGTTADPQEAWRNKMLEEIQKWRGESPQTLKDIIVNNAREIAGAIFDAWRAYQGAQAAFSLPQHVAQGGPLGAGMAALDLFRISQGIGGAQGLGLIPGK
jgi:hypothetical protein